ncbi:hypothetical protein ACFSBZ_11420 [Amnibacterium flavum]|uniref:Vgb family protein n=1 Tax=Amnibacterium flavum TaxID=2173173 RepID=UPI001057BA5E|nr:hypothetical protein [Amnibacterium flavum]
MRRAIVVTIGAAVAVVASLGASAPASALSNTYVDYGEGTVGGFVSSLAVAPDGSVIVGDNASNTVGKYLAAPSGYTLAATYTGNDPFGVALEPDGDVVVADRTTGSINILRESGGAFSVISSVPVATTPLGVATDGDGTIFVADYGSDSLRIVEPSVGGGYTLAQSVPVAPDPRFVAVAPDGTVAISHQTSQDVTILTPSPSGSAYSVSTVTVGPALYGVAFRADGTLLAVSLGSFGAPETLYVARPGPAGYAVTTSQTIASDSYSIAVGADDRVLIGTLSGTITTYRAALTSSATPPSVMTVGVPLSVTLPAEGGTGDYVWSVSSGALPTGLTLGATGGLLGTPTTAGGWSATLSVADAANPANSTSVVLAGTVDPAPAGAPTSGAPSGAERGAVLAATGADPGEALGTSALLLFGGAVAFALSRRRNALRQRD